MAPVLAQVKPTQSMVRAHAARQYDWELDQEFLDALYVRKRGPAAAPEANGSLKQQPIDATPPRNRARSPLRFKELGEIIGLSSPEASRSHCAPHWVR